MGFTSERGPWLHLPFLGYPWHCRLYYMASPGHLELSASGGVKKDPTLPHSHPTPTPLPCALEMTLAWNFRGSWGREEEMSRPGAALGQGDPPWLE